MTPQTVSTNERLAEQFGDDIALAFFSPADREMSPEEYVAWHAHEWGCFSFHIHSYENVALGAWVRRVGELLFTDGAVERCREQFLLPEELALVRRREAEPF